MTSVRLWRDGACVGTVSNPVAEPRLHPIDSTRSEPPHPERAANRSWLHPSVWFGRLPRSVAAVLIGATAFVGGSTLTTTARAERVLPSIEFRTVDTGGIDRAIEAGRSSRSEGRNGAEGFLGRRQAEIARNTWAALSSGVRDPIAGTLSRASGPVERALIVKAMAARSKVLLGSEAKAQADAVAAIAEFARQIRGMPVAELVQATSLIDLDERVDASSFDPSSLDLEANDPRPPGYHDANNDGLFQRHRYSCGPASLDVLEGELDPIYAFALRRADFSTMPAGKDSQLSVLLEFGTEPTSRLFPFYRRQVSERLTALEHAGVLRPDRVAGLAQYLFDDGPDGAEVQATLTTLRAHHGGFPSDAIVRTLTGTPAFDRSNHYGPIGFRNIQRLLNERVGALLGVTFRLETLPADERPQSWTASMLDKVAKDVASGADILFGTSAPDHYWTINNVEGPKSSRRFEVHDVWSGSTQWVDQQELIDGSFARRFLPSMPRGTKVDLFFVVDDSAKGPA